MKKLLILFVSIALVMLCTPVCVGPVSAEVGDEVIHMFICYGQSWSVGYDATPVITTTPRYDNLMLDTGIRTADIGDMSAVAMSFVPAVESQVIEMVNGVQRRLGETPVSAQMNMVQQMMEAEKSIVIADLTYTMLGTAPGMGSKTLAQLEKGTVYYDRLIAQVQQANAMATAMGKRLVVEAFSWVQGSLGRAGNYAEALEQLRLDIDTDVKAITQQSEIVRCITWQSFIYNKSLRAKQVYDQYVGAAEKYPYIICAGAAYHLNNVRAGNLHLNSESQDWLGAYFGVAYKRTIIDGEKFEPLKPIGANANETELYVKFHVPYGSLVFDKENFSDAANEVQNEGFKLYAADGTEKVITEVAIVSSDTVKIVCAENVVGTDRLTYGDITTDAYKWVNHNRGHLRDSQGDYLQYKSGNPGDTHSVLPLHNWCVLFDKTIDELGSFCDEVLPGDVDGNGEVANRDLGLLQRHLNGWQNVNVDLTACDVDGNGEVTNRDLGLLQRYLNGWDVTLG